jgi:hypothetical protein
MLASMVHTVIFRKIFCRPGFVIERIMICFEHTNIRRQYIVHRTHIQYQLHVCDLPSKLGHTAVFLLCNQNQAYSTVTMSTRSITSHNDICTVSQVSIPKPLKSPVVWYVVLRNCGHFFSPRHVYASEVKQLGLSVYCFQCLSQKKTLTGNLEAIAILKQG